MLPRSRPVPASIAPKYVMKTSVEFAVMRRARQRSAASSPGTLAVMINAAERVPPEEFGRERLDLLGRTPRRRRRILHFGTVAAAHRWAALYERDGEERARPDDPALCSRRRRRNVGVAHVGRLRAEDLANGAS